MSLIKLNRRRFPWLNDGVPSWLDADEFLADDFFLNERNVPAMNVKENKTNFEIELAIPGFSKNEIEVVLENDLLQVSAKKSEEKKEDKEGYSRKEFSYNQFERKLQLPVSVDSSEKVKAVYNNGILKLELLKKEEAKTTPKKLIQVN
jgi:HSP20 family protein